MDVIVRGRNVAVPDQLRASARRKVSQVGRIAPDVAWAEVDFSEERNPRIRDRHRCAVVVHRRRARVAAHAAAADPEGALERALDKLRHQVVQRKDHR